MRKNAETIRAEFEYEFKEVDLSLITNGMCVVFANGRSELVVDKSEKEGFFFLMFLNNSVHKYNQNGVNEYEKNYDIVAMSKGNAFDAALVKERFQKVYNSFLPTLVLLSSLKSETTLKLKCIEWELKAKKKHYHNNFHIRYSSTYISFGITEKGVSSEFTKMTFILGYMGVNSCHVKLIHNLETGEISYSSKNASVTMIAEMQKELQPIIEEIKILDKSYFPDFKVEYVQNLFGDYMKELDIALTQS